MLLSNRHILVALQYSYLFLICLELDWIWWICIGYYRLYARICYCLIDIFYWHQYSYFFLIWLELDWTLWWRWVSCHSLWWDLVSYSLLLIIDKWFLVKEIYFIFAALDLEFISVMYNPNIVRNYYLQQLLYFSSIYD